MSEAQRSALNALLFRTGDQSRDIVLALATNRPGDLDAAITDRIDEMLEFPLPREEERFRLLQLYLHRYVTSGERAGARGLWRRATALFRRPQEGIEVREGGVGGGGGGRMEGPPPRGRPMAPIAMLWRFPGMYRCHKAGGEDVFWHLLQCYGSCNYVKVPTYMPCSPSYEEAVEGVVRRSRFGDSLCANPLTWFEVCLLVSAKSCQA